MTYIKRLVMKGFKSFARETVINLDRHMNVVVGPNGSGKSNITDALCFVLGRLSIKSIRAAKSAHLIFSGNKQYKPANIAFIEIILDNSAKTFALDDNEIKIRRIVNKNGQSTYKINDQIKTRQEVLELLSQGFNIILQGEIENFVKMHGDDRRKVIEEVAGISIYEMRKEKSLKELEKTEERLRQVNAILRERTNYMKNLENEREQALHYQKLQTTIQKCKASIINKNVQENKKHLDEILIKIGGKEKEIVKADLIMQKMREEMRILNEKIDNISKTIQKSSGIEQDNLLEEISILKQEYAGSLARKENSDNKLLELERRKKALEESIKISEQEIAEMMKEKGKNKKKDIDSKKKKFEEYEESKRKYYQLKSNLSSLNTQIEDKKRLLFGFKNESNYSLIQIETLEKEIKIKGELGTHNRILNQLRELLIKDKEKIEINGNSLLEKEKELAIDLKIINDSEELKKQVSKLDICPLCKTKITEDHKNHVFNKSDNNIIDSKKNIEKLKKEIEEIKKIIQNLNMETANIHDEINTREISIIKMQSINDKKNQLKRNEEKNKHIDEEIKKLEDKRKTIEKELSIIKINEEMQEKLKLEISELERSDERNLGFEISSKQRELERIKLAIKQIDRDKEELNEDITNLHTIIEEKSLLIEEKEKQAVILKKKFQNMFEERNLFQDKLRAIETQSINKQNDKRLLENDINNIKIEKAQINGKIDSLNEEIKEFPNIELINIPIEKLKDKLLNVENVLSKIGSVNLRALDVYDTIKEEYDKIKDKVTLLDKEKEEILKIIEQIDRKKKKTFMNTLNKINDLFSRNFSQLSEKGIVTLEPQDKKEIFNAGLDIIVKVGTGKYFDITSLSGGEQSLVALSLIFAIQDLNPYCFYIFDEIDAALDRRNSEKLAYLLKKHMKKGQYLIITHNDSIISESSNILFGVSMQEGISKVLSIEV